MRPNTSNGKERDGRVATESAKRQHYLPLKGRYPEREIIQKLPKNDNIYIHIVYI